MALETGFIERLDDKVVDIIDAFSAAAPPEPRSGDYADNHLSVFVS